MRSQRCLLPCLALVRAATVLNCIKIGACLCACERCIHRAARERSHKGHRVLEDSVAY